MSSMYDTVDKKEYIKNTSKVNELVTLENKVATELVKKEKVYTFTITGTQTAANHTYSVEGASFSPSLENYKVQYGAVILHERDYELSGNQITFKEGITVGEIGIIVKIYYCGRKDAIYEN